MVRQAKNIEDAEFSMQFVRKVCRILGSRTEDRQAADIPKDCGTDSGIQLIQILMCQNQSGAEFPEL